MKKANIVIMGKTGAGKSTLVNAVLGGNYAKVGQGKAQTTENYWYSKTINGIEFNLYDTVGLEINSAITKATLNDIKERINYSCNNSGDDDINLVWYCINPNNSRFENFETQLIKEMIYTYEIPFVIVLTQSYSKKKVSEMETSIYKQYSSRKLISLLAEPYETDVGIVPAFGVDRLLYMTLNGFQYMKIDVLDQKRKDISVKLHNYEEMQKVDIDKKRNIAQHEIKKAANAAFVVGCIPGASLFSLQPTYITAINKINDAFGISLDSNSVDECAVMIIASILISPLCAIPVLSGALSKSMIIDCSNKYLENVIEVVKKSEPSEIKNSRLMAQRIKDEIENRKRG